MAKFFGRISGLSKRHGFAEVAGLFLLLAAVIALAALVDYAPRDPTWFQVTPDRQVSHSFGRVGATLAEAMLQAFGTASLLVPVVLAVLGWNRFRGRSAASSYGRLLGFVVLGGTLTAILDLWIGHVAIRGETIRAGGSSGH